MKKKELILILTIAIIIALFFSGYSLGKEYTSTNIETSGKIAEPILIVENSPIIEVDGRKEREDYSFTVKNYKENGQITQVDLNYYIEILSKTNEAISFKLYNVKPDNEEIEINLDNNKTENIKMENKEMQEHKYKLQIIYDKTKNHSLEDIFQDVQIKVHSEQAKG